MTSANSKNEIYYAARDYHIFMLIFYRIQLIIFMTVNGQTSGDTENPTFLYTRLNVFTSGTGISGFLSDLGRYSKQRVSI